MSEELLMQEILHYLEDETYRYAVLIDGDWGSGKTFFAKEILQKRIEEKYSERIVRYYSLYGVESLASLKEAIVFDLFQINTNKTSERLAKQVSDGDSDNTISQLSKKVPEVWNSKAFSIGKKILGPVLKEFLPVVKEINMGSFLTDLAGIENTTFIFDDVERCDFSINELLGFINELVEHIGAKAILIANEKEINAVKVTCNEELQYIVASSQDIQWPVEKTQIGLTLDHNDKPASLEEINRRRNIAFSINKGNEEYKRIKEKLIGVTFHYKADFKNICKLFIDLNFEEGSRFKEHMLDNIESQCSILSIRGHNNLRTYQFYISRVKTIESGIDTFVSGFGEEEIERIIEKIIEVCFSETLKFKGGYKESMGADEPNNMISFDAMTDYIEKGIFDRKAMEDNIQTYVDKVLHTTIDRNDPYIKLTSEYYVMTEEGVQGLYDKVLKRLEQDKYPIESYPEMLMRISAILHFGFSEQYLLNVKDKMVNNIKKESSEESTLLDYSVIHLVEEQSRRELLKKCIDELNVQIKSTQNNNIRYQLREIANSESLGSELTKKTLELAATETIGKVSALSELSAETVITVLKTSSPSKLYEFYLWLKKWLGSLTTDLENYESEYLTCVSIRNALDKEDKNNYFDLHDRILNHWITCIHEDICSFVERKK